MATKSTILNTTRSDDLPLPAVVVEKMVEAARSNPGLPIALIEIEGCLCLGIMSIFPEDDDWFQRPESLLVIEASLTRLKFGIDKK